jgi:hypothetical protein
MSDMGNRTDLQNPAQKIAVSAARGQTYGKAGEQVASQKAVPMAAPPTDRVQRPTPGGLGAFGRETERPNEPLTAGADFGMGPDMMQAGIPVSAPGFNETLEELRVLYNQFPNEDLASLITALMSEGA